MKQPPKHPDATQDPVSNDRTFDDEWGTDGEGEFPLDLPVDHPDYEEEAETQEGGDS